MNQFSGAHPHNATAGWRSDLTEGSSIPVYVVGEIIIFDLEMTHEKSTVEGYESSFDGNPRSAVYQRGSKIPSEGTGCHHVCWSPASSREHRIQDSQARPNL